MYGEGMEALLDAMDYILTDKANINMIQFSSEDKIDVIAFGTHVNLLGSAKGDNTQDLLNKIKNFDYDGATALYPAAAKAIELLKDESNEYNTSVILMTDGAGNIGAYSDLESSYKMAKKEIPIYGITFGEADLEQLEKMARLSNGKVFDGKVSLVEAFKSVRGYN
jgi:Ca-activated chloride channel family protein